MKKPTFTLSRASLYKLIITLIILHTICLICSMLLLVAAVKMKISYGDYVNMVTHGDGHILPALLSLIGILSLPLSTCGLFLSVKSRSFSKQSSRKVLTYIFSTCAVAVCNISVVIAAGVHAYRVQSRLHDGIMSAMEQYNRDITAKITVDTLQIKLKCCGSKSFKDWFRIAWIDTSMGGVAPRGDFISDDVPFSCCSGSEMYPCIHHGILSSSNIYRYDPQRQLSVSKHGCHNVLVTIIKKMVHYMVGIIIGFSLVQIVMALLVRIVQTALSIDGKIGRKTGIYRVWIFGSALTNKHEEMHLLPRRETDDSYTDSSQKAVKYVSKRQNKYFKDPVKSSRKKY